MLVELLRATITVFSTQLRTSLRSVRFLLCGLLAAAPVGFSFFLTLVVDGGEEVPIGFLAWMMIAQGITPLLALIFGSAVISEEVSDRTITYLFTRPIPRAAVFLGRWLASVALISVLLVLSTFATVAILNAHFVVGLAKGPVLETSWSMIQGVLLGAAVYSAVFAALGALIKHPMIVGLGYVFAFEFLLVNAPLPGSLQHMAIQFQLRSFVKGSGAAAWNHEQIFRVNDLVERSEALGTLGIALVVALALGSFLVSRRQYELTA